MCNCEIWGIYMVNTPVCQIVGHKNAGKTTLMSKLINYYSSCGVHVGALKHHGHGGEPEAFHEVKETDSTKHLKAGAIISGVQGENTLQLSLEPKKPLDLTQILTMYESSEPDIILVEGYKNASFPKIVLLNDVQDEYLLETVPNTIAIGALNKELLYNRSLFTIPLLEVEKRLPEIAAYIHKKVVLNKRGI